MLTVPWQPLSNENAVAVLTVRGDGALRFAGFGGDAADAGWADLIAPGDLAGFHDAWGRYRRAASSGDGADDRAAGFEHVVRCLRPDGSQGPCLLRLSPGNAPQEFLGVLSTPAPSPCAAAEPEAFLDKARSQLIACVSHELRTPLNAIIGFSELIATAGTSLPVRRTVEYASDIAASAHHLLSLIDEIIETAALPVTARKGCDQVVDLETEICRAVRLATNAHKARRVRFDIQAEEAGAVVTDAQALGQLLYQIADNAAKFSEPGSTVTVRAEAAGSGVRIQLTDIGPGFPQNVLDSLGQPFVRGGDAYRAEAGGLGLGLRIALNLTGAIGGALTIRNRASGGATVSLTVPNAAADLCQAIGGTNGERWTFAALEAV